MNATIIYMGVSIVLIGVLLGLLIRCQNSKDQCDGYCVCTGVGKENCRSQEQSDLLYQRGLTEYSNFAQMQKAKGGPTWKTSTHM